MKQINKKTLITASFALPIIFSLGGCANMTAKKDADVIGVSQQSLRTTKQVIRPEYYVKTVWKNRVGSSSDSFKLAPAYSQGKLFTSDARGRVTAVNSKTGQLIWRSKTKANISTGPGLAANTDIMAVGTANGKVLVLNKANGKILWTSQISDQIISTPAVNKNYVIVKSIDGNVTALNAQTGKQAWIYKHTAPELILRASSSPRISGNRVIIGFADGRLASLALNSGRLIWQQDIAIPGGSTDVQNLVDVDDTPVVQSGSIYTASYQGNVASLNAKSGEVFWKHKLSSYTGLAADSSKIFVSDADSQLWAFDSLSGGVNWKQKQTITGQITAPALMNHTVVVGSAKGYLDWFSKNTGKVVARVKVDRSGMNAAPLVVGNTVYAYTRNGTLAAYQLEGLNKQTQLAAKATKVWGWKS